MTRVSIGPSSSRDSKSCIGDVDALIASLSLEEKVELLAGQGTFRTTGMPDKGIPQLIVRGPSRRANPWKIGSF